MTAYGTAQQASATYVLTSPNGFRAVFNNQSDADYVGALVGEDAVSGLDSPEVRNAVFDLVEADGAIAGNQYHSSRPITLQASILATSVTARNAMETKLRKAVNDCLRGDGTLAWTPDGSISQFVSVRKYQRLQIKGAWVKDVLVSLVAAYPYIHSSTLRTSTFAYNTNQVLENQGTDLAFPPLIRVNGPSTGTATGPKVTRTWGSEVLYVKLTGLVLAAGEYVDINFWNRTAIKSDGSNVYSYLDFTNSRWWGLGSGNNTVRLDWDTGGTGSTLRVDWRDAWL